MFEFTQSDIITKFAVTEYSATDIADVQFVAPIQDTDLQTYDPTPLKVILNDLTVHEYTWAATQTAWSELASAVHDNCSIEDKQTPLGITWEFRW